MEGPAFSRAELIAKIEHLERELHRLRSGTAMRNDELLPRESTEVAIAAAGFHPSSPFLARILDSVADPIFVKDENHRWLAVNQAFCSLMGQPREGILGKSDFDYFPKDEAKTFWEKDELVFANGGVNINEEPLTDSSGKTHVLVTKKSVFEDESGNKVLVGIIRDVTEQKNAEAALRQAHAELERRVAERSKEIEAVQARLRQAQKMEAVGQLTGGIAHDFNNILAMIMGNLELVGRFVACDDAADCLNSALEAAERGAMLTDRLLTFSRRQALQPVVLDTNSLIEDLLRLLRGTLGETIEITMDLEPDLAPIVADPVQLETALLNLAINARDAMPEGGILRISTRSMVVAGEHPDLRPGPYVRIEVVDTGMGIDEAHLDRVFEPFFTTKETGKGSGLGLSMVYGFIKQSRGHLNLSSEQGRGTSISLFLPQSTTETATPRTFAPSPPTNRPTATDIVVLIVEDDPGFSRVAVSLVESLGYQALSAENAAGALDILRSSGRVDVVLCDVVLPGGTSGPELARRAASMRKDLDVIFMSGYTNDALRGESGDLDPDVCLLRKPFRRADVARVLLRALRRKATAEKDLE